MPDGLPPLRQGTHRHRSRAAASSGLGTSRDQADRHRISAASPRLLLRLLHLRRTARGRAHRPSRAAAHRLRRLAHGLLSPVEAPGRPVPEHDPQPARQRRLDGQLAEPRRRGRRARLRGTGRAAARRKPLLHIDESPTKEGHAKAWVWTFVAATFTFFACRTSRGGRGRSRNCSARTSPASSTATGPACIGASAACNGAGPI